MSKLTYCANCGLRLTVFKKAIPTHGRIVDLVLPHKCTEEPIEFDITPIDVPAFQLNEDSNKFVKKLNELSPDRLPNLNNDLHDRRPTEQVKSSAPESLITNLRGIQNTSPVNDPSNEPE